MPASKRGRRLVFGGAAAALAVLVIAALAYFTPILSVRTIEISGNATVSEETIRSALAVPIGQPLLQVDAASAGRRVAALPQVAQVRAQRVYPSTLRITVTERTPTAFVAGAGGARIFDAAGVEYETLPTPPAGVPELVTPNAGAGDPATGAAVAALAVLPPQLRVQVVRVDARSVDDVRFTLGDQRTLVWGGPEDGARKAQVALGLLSQPGGLYDVSSPDLPTIR